MRIRRFALPFVLPLLLVPGACSSDDDDPKTDDTTSASSTPTDEPVESEPAASPLEGAWTADITPEAYAAAIVAAGYDEKLATQMATENLPGPEFRLEFLGDRFRLSYAPTDEQFMSGTLTLDGEQVTLDDEAPVGVYTWSYAVDGDTLDFSEGSTSNPEIELAPGVPDFVPGLGFLEASPWVRAS